MRVSGLSSRFRDGGIGLRSASIGFRVSCVGFTVRGSRVLGLWVTRWSLHSFVCPISHTPTKQKPQKQISSLSPQLPPPPFPPMLVHIPCRQHSRRHLWPAAHLLRPRNRFVPHSAEPCTHPAAQAGNTRQQQGTHHESTDARECKRHSARCGLGLSVRGEGLGLGA